MGAVADAALAAGGEVIGVIPRRLVDRELAHPGLTDLRVVETLHERKAEMAALSDGFIALPGGLGTLEELAEVASWAQLGLHAKPIGLLGRDGFWDPLLAWLDHAVAEGFVAPDHRRLVALDPDLDALLERFGRPRAPARSSRAGCATRTSVAASARPWPSGPWSASGSATASGRCPVARRARPRPPGSPRDRVPASRRSGSTST